MCYHFSFILAVYTIAYIVLNSIRLCVKIAVCSGPSLQNRIYICVSCVMFACGYIFACVFASMYVRLYVCGRRRGCGRGMDVKMRKRKIS